MSEIEQPRRRRKKRHQPDPRIIPLTEQRENREHLTLLRVSEEVTLGPNTRIVILPGDLGKGWQLKVFYDPEERE